MKIKQIGILILLLSLLAPMGLTLAATGMKMLTIGYLELKSDPRYFEARLDARYPAQPWSRPEWSLRYAAKSRANLRIYSRR
jgi:hypothetical protein